MSPCPFVPLLIVGWCYFHKQLDGIVEFYLMSLAQFLQVYPVVALQAELLACLDELLFAEGVAQDVEYVLRMVGLQLVFLLFTIIFPFAVNAFSNLKPILILP